MGYRCSWIALRGGAADAVLAALDVVRTGRSAEPVYDPGLYGVALDGWYLAVGDGWDYMGQIVEAQAAALSDADTGEEVSFHHPFGDPPRVA